MKTLKRMASLVLSLIMTLVCTSIPASAYEEPSEGGNTTDDFSRMIEYMQTADKLEVKHVNGAVVYIGIFSEYSDDEAPGGDRVYNIWNTGGQLGSYGSDQAILNCDGSSPYCTFTVRNDSDPLTPSGNDPVLYTNITYTLNGVNMGHTPTLTPSQAVKIAIDNSANGVNLSISINVGVSAGILAPVKWGVTGGMYYAP